MKARGFWPEHPAPGPSRALEHLERGGPASISNVRLSAVAQQLRDQRPERAAIATQRIAVPGEDRLELRDRLLEAVVDDDVVELAEMAHVAHRIAEPASDDLG